MKRFIPWVIILGVFITAAFMQWGYMSSNTFEDFGCEAYIAWQMTKGALLYRDIFNIFGPLAYQINSFLFSIFGVNLYVLFAAGLTSALISVLLLYKISGYIFNKFFSLIYTLTIILFMVFYHNAYATPYTYAVVYAQTAILAAILSSLNYLKTKKTGYFYLACLFYGLSITIKYEFAGYLIILLLQTITVQKLKLRNFLTAAGFLGITPIMSFGTLFLQGVRIPDLINSLLFTIKFMSSPYLLVFYQYYSSALPSRVMLPWDALFLLANMLSFFLIYLTVMIIRKRKPSVYFLPLAMVSLIVSLLIFYFVNVFFTFAYSWISFCSLLILIVYLFRNFRNLTGIVTEPFFLISLSAVLFCIKGLFHLPLFPYGVYLLPLAIMVILFTLLNILKRNPADLDFKQKTAGIILLIFALSNFLMIRRLDKHVASARLETQKGTVFTTPEVKNTYDEALAYMATNTNSSDRILFIPPGSMLNFLSGRSSDNKLYVMFLPPSYMTYGEEALLNDLYNKKIEYLMYLKRPLNEVLLKIGRAHV
jgi:hypothetical protein